MRRKDRAVTDSDTIRSIILKCDCCRLGFCADDGAYIVPMNFGYEESDGERIFYFHCAAAGRKLDLIGSGTKAGFELDTDHAVNAADTPCGYSFGFSSVIGTGRVEIVTNTAEKEHALGLIMSHYAGKRDWSFAENEVRHVTILRLTAESLECKVHE